MVTQNEKHYYAIAEATGYKHDQCRGLDCADCVFSLPRNKCASTQINKVLEQMRKAHKLP